jgi:hypothetical protein
MRNILFILFFCFIIGCNKNPNQDCGFAYKLGDPLIVRIKQNGKDIADSTLKTVRLSYYNAGNKKYITDFNPVPDTSVYAHKGIMATRNIVTLGTQTYFIEYNNSNIYDSLFICYSNATPATGCTEILSQIRFNGQVPPIDPAFKFGVNVYIFNK